MPAWKRVHPPLRDDPPVARLLYGYDVVQALANMPSASVHVVVTSPPYWGLRDYGVVEQIGLEDTPDAYVARLVATFREVARVLRTDGTLWLNLGDSYAQARGHGHWVSAGAAGDEHGQRVVRFWGSKGAEDVGLKPKNLVGISWRVARALQEDGWVLRAACPWVKRNAMPSSVLDRPTSATETIFLFSHPDGDGSYYYDQDAVRVGSASGRFRRDSDPLMESLALLREEVDALLKGGEGLLHVDGDPVAFVVNPKPYAGAHFACWPPKLVEPMVRASTSEHGCCPACGAPWLRQVDKTSASRTSSKTVEAGANYWDGPGQARTGNFVGATTTTRGWAPSCACPDNDGSAKPMVLDPFSGSATTGAVALQHGRSYVGLDLNESYLPMAEARLLGAPPPAGVPASDEASIFDL